MFTILAVLLALELCAGSNTVTPKLVVVEDDIAAKYGARSLDGSNPAYYWAAATNASKSDRFVLYFKGGGWCIDDVSCADRSKTELGSSKKLADTFDFAEGFSSSDCSTNPSFCDANRVILWYTDGGSFTGGRELPVTVSDQVIWYRGHANLQAIVESIKRRSSLAKASEVIVSGGSAGGLAAYLHADEMKAMIGSPSLRKYKVAPASGFFLNHTNADGQYAYGAQMAYIFDRMNSTAGVPLSCRSRVGAGREHECITAAAVWQTMETPIFMQNSAIDSWQLGCVLTALPTPTNSSGMRCHALPEPFTCVTHYHTCPYDPVIKVMQQYRADFLSAYRTGPTATKPGNGAFIHTCASHVGSQGDEWKTIQINDTSFFDAANAWWEADEHEPAASHTYLPCELGDTAPFQCNPTCGSV